MSRLCFSSGRVVVVVLETYKVGRVQDAVLHRVGQVQRELPGRAFLGLLQEEMLLGLDLKYEALG